MKKRPNIPNKFKALLQQEIASLCPFCSSSDVGHFEIHHIDENPENNEFWNLIMICPTCHSKITKGDIERKKVERVKANLPSGGNIEFVDATIDKNCSWTKDKDVPYAFFDHVSQKNPFPIISFSFINHSKRTVVLRAIHLRAKPLPRGLSGLPAPGILNISAVYPIRISYEESGIEHLLEDQLEIPVEQAFKFQVELYEQWGDYKKWHEIEGRIVLYFTFLFNGDIKAKAPTILLNCKDENEGMSIQTLS